MSTPNDGGPAFPRRFTDSDMDGMSLRDYFAGQVINSTTSRLEKWLNPEEALKWAREAYVVADAMLKVKNNP